MAYLVYLFQSSILALAAIQGIVAVQFDVKNNAGNSPGGIRFDREIGIEFAKQTMETTTNFIWKLFQENTPADRKDLPQVLMAIENYRGVAAFTNRNLINVSSVFIEFAGGNLKWEFTSLIYHEMTHIWQWSGDYTAPGGLTEGIADYAVLKANYYGPGYPKPGVGNRWDEGYAVTARFLEYCDTLRPGFTIELNKKMRYSWSENFFVELVGKPVDQLWREYKAKYGGSVVSDATMNTQI